MGYRLDDHIADLIDTALDDAQPTPDVNMFSAIDVSNPSAMTFTPNPSFWAKNFDLTCVSLYNNSAGNQKAGTLITPKHLLTATHYSLAGIGLLLWLQDAAGVGSWYTIEHFVRIDPSGNPYPVDYQPAGGTSFGFDITIVQLDRVVASGIKPVQILPPDYADWFDNYGAGVPVIKTNAARTVADETTFGVGAPSDGIYHDSKQAHVANTNTLNSFFPNWGAPTQAQRLATYKALIGGDSGNRAYLFADPSQPIDPSLQHHEDRVNAAIALFPNNGGYTLTRADLSGFDTVSASKRYAWKTLTADHWDAFDSYGWNTFLSDPVKARIVEQEAFKAGAKKADSFEAGSVEQQTFAAGSQKQDQTAE
jgi:hypothetical protein